MKRAVCILCALAAVFTGRSVFAKTTETLKDTVTFDGQQVTAINTGIWRSANYESYKVEAESETDSNIVLKMPGASLLSYTNFAGNADNVGNIKKGAVRVKLSSVEEGATELFYYRADFLVSNYDGTPIKLQNGGAYVTDIQNGAAKEICFIEDGTMEADTWYTVERIFDFREIGVNRQKAAVYDAAGKMVGESEWTICGNIMPHASYQSRYSVVQFRTSGYSDMYGAYLDDLQKYYLTVTDLTANTVFNDAQNRFEVTFSEPMDARTINSENICLVVNGEAQPLQVEYDADNNVAYVSFSRLPFDENVTLVLKTGIKNSDGWNLREEQKNVYKTAKDPFTVKSEIINDGGVSAEAAFTNNDTIDREYMAVLFVKNADGTLKSVNVKCGIVAAGDTDAIKTDAIDVGDKETAEFAVFDNWYNFRRISEE